MLTHDFSSGGDNRASVVHPANILFTIDRVLDDINGHTMLWESKLSKLLRACSKKQWQPILLDTQSSLRTIGGSLIALGMVEVVGRPVVMLYPVYMVILQALKLSREIEMNNNKITVHQYLQIFKIGVYFIFAYLLLTVLAMYTGLGYTCLLIGGGAVAVASNDEFTKQAAPVIAPHMANLDLMMNQLHRLEVAVMGGSNKQARSTGFRVDESVSLLQGLFQQGMKMIGKESNNNDRSSSSSGGGRTMQHQQRRERGGEGGERRAHMNHSDPRVEELDDTFNDELYVSDHTYSTAATATGDDTSTTGLRFRQKPSDVR